MEDFLTVKEAAEATGLTRRQIRRRIDKGQVESVVEKGVRYISPENVEKLRELASTPEESGAYKKADILDAAESYLSGDNETNEQRLERDNLALQADLRRAKALVREFQFRAAAEDRISAEIRRSMESNPYRPIISRPAPTGTNGNAESEHEMLLLVSDAHYPEVVNPEEALGIEFGPETVEKRMAHLIDRTLRLKGLHEANYPVGKLTVAVLGDMLSGNIHEELEVTNALPMGEALTNMSYMLHDMGIAFAQEFPEVEMIIMPGNHPRMTKKPRYKQKWDNFEYIMGQLVLALAQDAYEVVVPKDMIYTHNIFDQRIGLMHGDGSKAASFAGIPFYGLKQRAEAIQAMRSLLDLDRLDMLCMGHYHQMVQWTVGDCHVFINGAIKGGDEYGIGTRNSVTEPVQALMTFHEDHGWISTERIPLSSIV